MCGVICIKAVVDYYQPDLSELAPDPLTIFKDINARHGWDKTIGITHAAELAELQHLGLLSWRRDWENPQTEPQQLPQAGGYNGEQIRAVGRQWLAESNFQSKREKQRFTIINALKNQDPVIASMAPNFGQNSFQHQVVVMGWLCQRGHEKVLVMDPEKLPGENIYAVPADYFFDYFKQRAIFTTLVRT